MWCTFFGKQGQLNGSLDSSNCFLNINRSCSYLHNHFEYKAKSLLKNKSETEEQHSCKMQSFISHYNVSQPCELFFRVLDKADTWVLIKDMFPKENIYLCSFWSLNWILTTYDERRQNIHRLSSLSSNKTFFILCLLRDATIAVLIPFLYRAILLLKCYSRGKYYTAHRTVEILQPF